MGFLSTVASMGVGNLLSGIGGLAKDIRTAITGESSLSPEAKARLEQIALDLEAKTIELEGKVTEIQGNVIMSEAKGESFLQRNWRPITMLVFVVIIANNYILYPYLGLFFEQAPMLEIPPNMWDLLKIGLGGYVLGRSAEKGVKAWRDK